jgi:hypothetical protein
MERLLRDPIRSCMHVAQLLKIATVGINREPHEFLPTRDTFLLLIVLLLTNSIIWV